MPNWPMVKFETSGPLGEPDITRPEFTDWEIEAVCQALQIRPLVPYEAKIVLRAIFPNATFQDPHMREERYRVRTERR